MKTWVKPIVMTLLAAVPAVALTACGASGKEEPDKGKTPSNVPDVTQEKREITFYTPVAYGEETFNLRFGDIVKKKFPNYTINFMDTANGGPVSDMITRGTSFDIIFTTAGALEKSIFQYGLEQDLSGLIKSHNVDLSRFDPSFRSILGESFGGKIYFLPVHADNVVMFYNKAPFDKFNVPYLKDGMTWEDIYGVAQKLSRTDGGVEYIGFNPAPLRYFRMNQLSIPLINPTTLAPTINTDERWAQFFRKYAEEFKATINDSKGSFTLDSGKQNDLFFDGRQAMLLSLPFIMTSRADQFKNIQFGVVSAPVLKDAPKNGFAPYPVNFAITKTSKNKDAAMEVLKYLVSDEAQQYLAKKGFGPVVKSVDVQKALGADSGAYASYNWQAVFHTSFAPYTFIGPYVGDLQTIYEKQFGRVINNEIDINTARRVAEEEAKAKIEEIKKLIPNDLK
ncbi:MAG: extracellular solute-binding protein family 1 [Paenibacillus sp.]|jgi:multiple sugar transport system substrate-binding protein|nr:extracellular solute-binding protein family 1 [Paenibacillus sp.]